ncbi:rab escort protein 1 [Typha angustifolia]|uniref:rab escort protein 1 n=1 Tax=Typha angustifolia TaxID=59011 RepID=UPI003C2C3670
MAETSTLTTTHDYPAIDPTSFDLIVSGTGFPESLLAAAAAAAGKSVLHVDPHPFYGSHFASLPLPSLSSFLSSPSYPYPFPSPSSSSSYTAVELRHHLLYSAIETSGSPPEPCRNFVIDLAGPRMLYCADEAVDLLLRSGASHHVEFKSVDSSLIYWEGRLCFVPDSRQAIFKDRTLGLAEKSQMMRFLKLVQNHIASSGGEVVEDGGVRISDEDLQLPFVDFLQKQRLPRKIRAIVLYAIAMADYDQDNANSCNKLVTTKEGIETIALYTSSIGRFTNAVGAFIYPMYGHGELPQAFCRCAAVKGALYVLRMPVIALLIDKEHKQYTGVRLASGQDILSRQLVMAPSYEVPSSFSPCDGTSNLCNHVARGVCITSSSIQRDSSNIMLVFPPKSLHSEQLTTIRALQLSSNVAVCPPGLFVVYLSIPCTDASSGKGYIKAAMDVLFTTHTSNGSECSLATNNGDQERENKPTLIWNCLYVQELTKASSDAICLCPMPDESLEYKNLLESTRKLFTKMYPNEEFLAQTITSENLGDDNGSSD